MSNGYMHWLCRTPRISGVRATARKNVLAPPLTGVETDGLLLHGLPFHCFWIADLLAALLGRGLSAMCETHRMSEAFVTTLGSIVALVALHWVAFCSERGRNVPTRSDLGGFRYKRKGPTGRPTQRENSRSRKIQLERTLRQW